MQDCTDSRMEELLEALIEEIKAQGELNRINNTVLMRRLMKDSETPAHE